MKLSNINNLYTNMMIFGLITYTVNKLSEFEDHFDFSTNIHQTLWFIRPKGTQHIMYQSNTTQKTLFTPQLVVNLNNP